MQFRLPKQIRFRPLAKETTHWMCVWECQREGIFPNKNSGYCSRHPENGIPEGWTEAAASSGACMTVLGTAAPGRWADVQGSGLGSAAPSGLAHGLSGPQGLGWRHAQSPQPAQRTPAPGHLHQRGVPSRLCPATCDSLTPVQGLPGPSRRENAQAHWLPSNLAVTILLSVFLSLAGTHGLPWQPRRT